MKRSISSGLVVAALALGGAAGCEQMERDVEETGEGAERGGEELARDTREGFGEVAEEARHGRENIEQEIAD